MRKLQIGIIGCGAIAKIRHLPECKNNPNVEIFGVCDLNEERVTQFARAYKTKAFMNYHEMLKSSELDAVIICLPHHLHARVAIDAAMAGKHILVEKPIATTVDDAWRMIEAAEANGVKLMVAHNQRFIPSHVKAKELLDSGQLGKVYSFRSTFGHSGPENWSLDGAESFYFQSPHEVFGVLGDLAIHKVDLIQHLLASNVQDVVAITGTVAKTNTEFEDHAVLSVKLENGVVGSIIASWGYLIPDVSTVIHCELGTIFIESDEQYPLIVKFKDGSAVKYELPDFFNYERKQPNRSGVVYEFVQSVLNNNVPPITGKEALDALAVILKAQNSHVEKVSI